MDTGSAARTPGFRREGPTGPLWTTTHHWSRQPCPAGVKFYRGVVMAGTLVQRLFPMIEEGSVWVNVSARERNLMNIGGVPVPEPSWQGLGTHRYFGMNERMNEPVRRHHLSTERDAAPWDAVRLW